MLCCLFVIHYIFRITLCRSLDTVINIRASRPPTHARTIVCFYEATTWTRLATIVHEVIERAVTEAAHAAVDYVAVSTYRMRFDIMFQAFNKTAVTEVATCTHFFVRDVFFVSLDPVFPWSGFLLYDF